MQQSPQELKTFLDQWSSDPNGCRDFFLQCREFLLKYPDVTFDFAARPGVTYSLRARRNGQPDRPLFALIDVIDENPRWLSVCFYGDMITDPLQSGELVPEGIIGEDGHCFDVEENSRQVLEYIARRIDEAYENAGR